MTNSLLNLCETYCKISIAEIINKIFSNYEKILSLLNISFSKEDLKEWLKLNSTHLLDFANFSQKNIFKLKNKDIVRIIVSSDKYVYITSEQFGKDVHPSDVDRLIFLKGYKQIPNLFMLETSRLLVTEKFKKEIDLVNVNMSIEDYVDPAIMPIISAMIRLLNYHSHVIDVDFKEKFINDLTNDYGNLDKIKSIFSKSPIYLGKGGEGMAFDIGDNKVLKIHTSLQAYNEFEKTINRLYNNQAGARTEIMVYDNDILVHMPSFNTTFYYVVLEKVNTSLSKEQTKFFEKFIDYIDKFMQSKLGYEVSDFTKEELETYTEEIFDELSTDHFIKNSIVRIEDFVNKKNIYLHPEWFKYLVEEFVHKFLTGRLDLHYDNLGINSAGFLRFYDPGNSQIDSD